MSIKPAQIARQLGSSQGESVPRDDLFICVGCKETMYTPRKGRKGTCVSCGAKYKNLGNGSMEWTNIEDWMIKHRRMHDVAMTVIMQIATTDVVESETSAMDLTESWKNLCKNVIEDTK